MWGYRRELHDANPRILALIAPSVAGGIAGALLLRKTPQSIFDIMVPFQILFATVLLMIQDWVQRKLKKTHAEAHRSGRWLAGAMLFQLLVALYGGYFGAGIGILMLAALSLLGLTNIHQMNGMKILFAGCINAVTSVYFVWAKMIYWPYFLVMVTGAIAGGYGGALFARRLGARAVRRIVIAVGLAMALSLFIKVL